MNINKIDSKTDFKIIKDFKIIIGSKVTLEIECSPVCGIVFCCISEEMMGVLSGSVDFQGDGQMVGKLHDKQGPFQNSS